MGDYMLFSKTRNYLMNASYNINLFQNGIYISNYSAIDCISENMLIIKFNEFILKINGQNFTINKMLNNEVLFNGQIEKVSFEYV